MLGLKENQFCGREPFEGKMKSTIDRLPFPLRIVSFVPLTCIRKIFPDDISFLGGEAVIGMIAE